MAFRSRRVLETALAAVCALGPSAAAADDGAAISRASWQRRLHWPVALCPVAAPGDGNGVGIVAIGAGRRWIRVDCALQAYQATQLVFLEEADGRRHLLVFDQFDARSATTRRYRSALLTGDVHPDPARRTLTVLRKYRGIGDCGQYLVYAAASAQPRLAERRERACPDRPDRTPPQQWPLRGR